MRRRLANCAFCAAPLPPDSHPNRLTCSDRCRRLRSYGKRCSSCGAWGYSDPCPTCKPTPTWAPSGKQAHVLRLWLDGWTYADIATALNTTTNYIGTVLATIRARGIPVPYRRLGYELANGKPRATTDFSKTAPWRAVLLADPCSYCGAPATDVDHITPQARGGNDDWPNLTPACDACNSSKHSESLLAYLARRPLLRQISELKALARPLQDEASQWYRVGEPAM